MLIRVPHKGSRLVTLEARLLTAGKTKSQQGYAHLLEHLQLLNALPISNKVGIQPSGWASREFTVFRVTAPDHLAKGAEEVLRAVLEKNSLDLQVVNRELGAIAVERRERFSTLAWRVKEALFRAAFDDNLYANSVLGSEENLQTVTLAELIEFRNTYYTELNTLFVVVGDAPHNVLQEVATHRCTDEGKAVFSNFTVDRLDNVRPRSVLLTTNGKTAWGVGFFSTCAAGTGNAVAHAFAELTGLKLREERFCGGTFHFLLGLAPKVSDLQVLFAPKLRRLKEVSLPQLADHVQREILTGLEDLERTERVAEIAAWSHIKSGQVFGIESYQDELTNLKVSDVKETLSCFASQIETAITLGEQSKEVSRVAPVESF
jgi:hypothetical protein